MSTKGVGGGLVRQGYLPTRNGHPLGGAKGSASGFKEGVIPLGVRVGVLSVSVRLIRPR